MPLAPAAASARFSCGRGDGDRSALIATRTSAAAVVGVGAAAAADVGAGVVPAAGVAPATAAGVAEEDAAVMNGTVAAAFPNAAEGDSAKGVAVRLSVDDEATAPG